MDLFDSATPEMKRLRNQRKDSSVLAQMQIMSAQITPTEVVYNLNGEFQKSRDIFGPLSPCEPSPVSIHNQIMLAYLGTEITQNEVNASPPKRGRRAARKVASALNAGPRLRARPSKRQRSQSPVKRDRFTSRRSTKEVSINPLVGPGFGKKYHNNDNDEFTIGMPKKRGFSVFHDGPEISPVRTETSLEEPT